MTPPFSSLRGYRREWLGRDLVAGLTVWAILVPEALAYASIAGVSPIVGLYAAPGALILYAAFGSSRHLVTGPMAATAALSAATVGEIASGGDEFTQITVALALCVGIVALVAGVARLGFVANLISEPVLKGFIIGLALTIIVGQVPKLLGIDSGEGDFFEKARGLIENVDETDGLTLVVGGLSLAAVLVLRRLAPLVPGSLLVVFASTGAVALLDLDDEGVAVVGSVSSGLPSFGAPDVSLAEYRELAAGALGVMLVAFAESLGPAKAYAARTRDEIDANRELVGLGTANLASGLSAGMIVNGSLSRTAVNVGAGAHTQLSGLVVAALTVLTLLFLTGLFEQLPDATLAAVVIAALIELVDIRGLRDLYGIYTKRLGEAYGIAARPDFIAAVAALLGVLIIGTLPGLFIGIAVSLMLLLYRVSRPHVSELGRDSDSGRFMDLARHPSAERAPGVVVLRIESGLFFANAEYVRARVLEAIAETRAHAVVLDAETIPYIDVTAVRVLDRLADELSADGVELLLARDIGQVSDVLRESGAGEPLLRVHPTVRDAVESARRDG